jgi:hypothetical protein
MFPAMTSDGISEHDMLGTTVNMGQGCSKAGFMVYACWVCEHPLDDPTLLAVDMSHQRKLFLTTMFQQYYVRGGLYHWQYELHEHDNWDNAVLDVAHQLTSCPGRLVTKEAIQSNARLWHDTIVCHC